MPLLGSLVVLVTASCLPGDERPEPGSIEISAEPSDSTAQGFTTADGWQLSFDRVLGAVGDIHLRNDACNAYSETHYDRLFDFAVLGRDKVGLVYGLGHCSVEFRLRSPSSDTLLGAGVSQDDVDFMRIEASDDYADDARASLVVRGRAERDGESKLFDWVFRRSYELYDCRREPGDGYVSVVDLRGGDGMELTIVVRAEELFRVAPIDEAALHFNRFAEADADVDGHITLSELGVVDAPTDDLGGLGAGGGSAIGSGSSDEAMSLADLVYRYGLPRVARLAAGGACEAELHQPRD